MTSLVLTLLNAIANIQTFSDDDRYEGIGQVEKETSSVPWVKKTIREDDARGLRDLAWISEIELRMNRFKIIRIYLRKSNESVDPSRAWVDGPSFLAVLLYLGSVNSIDVT